MINRLERIIKEYNEERKKCLDKAIKNERNKILSDKKTLKIPYIKGVIPNVPDLPKTRFFHETPTSLSGTNNPVLEYKPFLKFTNEIDVHFYDEATIYESPYDENTEIIIRLVNKTIEEIEGTLDQKLKEVSDFLDVDLSDLKHFYNKFVKKNQFTDNYHSNNLSDIFCSICYMFGCKIHKLSSDVCFTEDTVDCICDKFKFQNFKDGNDKNLSDKTIYKIYKSFNFDKCLASLNIFLQYNANVSCKTILNKFGESKKKLKKIKTSKFKITEKVKTFFNICSHSGPCYENSFCECYVNNTGCDLSCQCANCDYLFTGCSCKKGCNERCSCAKLSKECSTFCKCITCNNNLITNSVQKLTYIFPSTISGFGCFAGENIKRGEFVIEYLGEIISKKEGQRRSNFYDANKLSYLFDFSFTNRQLFIDANYLGNNSRFINHSTNPNIYCKIVEINKLRRIVFISLKDINIGEELFFNYNYKNEIKEMFGLID